VFSWLRAVKTKHTKQPAPPLMRLRAAMRKLWPLLLLLGCSHVEMQPLDPPRYSLVRYLEAIGQLPDTVKENRK
jgi:NADH:ubiquinone oxidoreductase subunit B-like Fe-S oxidoreductase